MLILNAQELESQGVPYRTATKILVQERLFVKGQSFSQRVKQVAIDLYAEYVDSGIHCLLVESAEQITLWRELHAHATSPDSAKTGAVDLTAYAQQFLQHQPDPEIATEMQPLSATQANTPSAAAQTEGAIAQTASTQPQSGRRGYRASSH